MEQNTIDFFVGLTKSIIHGLSEAQRLSSESIGNGIADGLEKSRKKIYSISISVVLIGTGFFLTLWGVATSIDVIFAMHGLGYVMIGIPAALLGALLYKR